MEEYFLQEIVINDSNNQVEAHGGERNNSYIYNLARKYKMQNKN